MSQDLRLGDWVTAYNPGIWQIYRILQHKGQDPSSGLEQQRTTIFVKRLVSASFKRSFSADCCHPTFVRRLDSGTRATLDDVIASNPKLMHAFARYRPKAIDCIYSAHVGLQANVGTADIEARIPRDRLFNELEIAPFLIELGFDTQAFPCMTVQFISRDHRCEDGYLVYEFLRAL